MDTNLDIFAKLAARYRIPEGQEGKFFVRDRGTRIEQAAHLGQSHSRRANKVMADEARRLPRKDTKFIRSELRDSRRGDASKPSSAMGTVVRNKYLPKDQQSKKFSRGRAVLNNDALKDPRMRRPNERRKLLAHEAFHVKAPRGVRNSETLAHAYGGFKGTKGSMLEKAKGALSELRHYKRSRDHHGQGRTALGQIAGSLGLRDRKMRGYVREVSQKKSMAKKLVQRARIAAKKRARARKAREGNK